MQELAPRSSATSASACQAHIPRWRLSGSSHRRAHFRSTGISPENSPSSTRRVCQATNQGRGSAVASEVTSVVRDSQPAQPVAPAATLPDALQAVHSLFAALNRRDVSAVVGLLSEDVLYDNLAASGQLYGRQAVGRFYLDAITSLPEDAVFVVRPQRGQQQQQQQSAQGRQQQQQQAPLLQVGVEWHVELHGVPLPLTRGLGLYCVDPSSGRLSRITDAPEHAVKLAAPLLLPLVGAAAPLLRGLGPTAKTVSGLLGSFSGESSLTGNGQGASSSRGSAGSGSSGLGLGSLGDVLPAVGAAGASVLAQWSNGMPLPQLPVPLPGPGQGQSQAQGRGQGTGRNTFRAQGTWKGAAAAAADPGVIAPTTATSVIPSSSNGNGSAPSTAPASHAAATNATTSSSSSTNTPTTSNGTLHSRASSATSSSSSSIPSTSDNGNSNGSSNGTHSSNSSSAPSAASNGSTAANSLASSSSSSTTSSPPVTHTRSPAHSFASSMDSGSDYDEPEEDRPGSSRREGAAGGPGGRQGQQGTGAGGVLGGSGGGGGGFRLPFALSQVVGASCHGLWEKDLPASQVKEYEAMLDVLQLGGLQKVTARLIDGLDMTHTQEGRFEVAFVTVVPFFRVTEKSKLGATTTMMRRDLRSGKQTNVATAIPGGVRVEMSWPNPLAGGLTEEYVVSEDGAGLAVTSSIRIGDKSAEATMVYRRSSRNKNDFLASRRNSYGSMEDVLRSQEQQYGKMNY